MLSPVLIGRKAPFEGVVANSYSFGLTFPKPFADRYWFSNVTIPANTGAEAEVPPIMGGVGDKASAPVIPA